MGYAISAESKLCQTSAAQANGVDEEIANAMGKVGAAGAARADGQTEDQKLLTEVMQKIGVYAIAAVVIDANKINRDVMMEEIESNWQFDEILGVATREEAEIAMASYLALVQT